MLLTWIIVFTISFYSTIRLSNFVISQALKFSKLHKISLLTTGFVFGAVFTSLPELIISTISSVMKSNEIALGNILGTNITEMLLVSGILFFLSKKEPARDRTKLKVFQNFIIYIVLITLFIFSVRKLDWIIGSILVFFYTLFVYKVLYRIKLPSMTKKEIKELYRFTLSLVVLIISSLFLVISIKFIVSMTKISALLLSAMIISIGTSLPTLLFAINSIKKSFYLAFGSIIGDCVFNLTFTLGTSSIINPLTFNVTIVGYLVTFLTVSSFLLIFSFKKLKSYEAGFLLIATYALYLFFGGYFFGGI